jgi:hypothetical protein
MKRKCCVIGDDGNDDSGAAWWCGVTSVSACTELAASQ